MITPKQQERLIQRFETLSELELDSVLDDLMNHLKKENLWHLLDSHVGIDDLNNEIEEHENTIKELEDEIEECKDSLSEISNLCDSVEEIQEYEDNSFEALKAVITKIKNLT